MKASACASSPYTDAPPDRRTGQDRRSPSAFPPKFSSQRRRSSKGRRETDRGGYVDIYDRGSWILALGVLTMSFLDALLTVYQLSHGAVREANPIMHMTIAWGGVYAFFSLKTAMTAFPLAIIMLHKEWQLARYMARLGFCFYVVILLYHVILFFNLSNMTLMVAS